MSKLNWKIFRFTHYYNAAALDHTLTWSTTTGQVQVCITNFLVTDRKCQKKLSNCCEVNLFLRHWHFQKTRASQKKFSTFMYEKRPLRTYHRPNHTTSSGTIIRMLFWIRIQRIFVRRQAVNSKPRSFWIHLRVSLAWLLLACCWCFALAK